MSSLTLRRIAPLLVLTLALLSAVVLGGEDYDSKTIAELFDHDTYKSYLSPGLCPHTVTAS